MSNGDEDILGESNKQRSPQESSVDPVISTQTPPSKFEGEDVVMAPVPSSSWFSVWPGSASNKNVAEITTSNVHPADTSTRGESLVEAPAGVEVKGPLPGSTWAFWSKDSQRPTKNGVEAEEPGELAITGEASQNNPSPANATILREIKDERVKKTNKRGRSLPDDVQESTSKSVHSDLSNKKQ
jgi:hypothetical protein